MCRRDLGQMAAITLHGAVELTQPGPGARGCDLRRWVEHLRLPVAFGEKNPKNRLLQVHRTLETPCHPELAHN